MTQPTSRPGEAGRDTGRLAGGDGEGEADLGALGLLDGRPDPGFDRFARLAAHLVRAPVALVSFLEGERQVFRAKVGLPAAFAEVAEMPLTAFFCQHVVGHGGPLAVEDARAHPVLSEYRAVREFGVVAYLGVPLVAAEGRAIGALCAIDHRPRAWSAEDLSAMEDLAGAASGEIALREELARRARSQGALREANRLLSLGEGLAHVGHWRAELPSGRLHWSPELYRIHGLAPDGDAPTVEGAIATYHPDDRDAVRRAIEETLRGGDRFEYGARVLRPDGEARHVVARGLAEREDGATSIVGVELDVTDLKRAEERAREAGALFRALFDHATDSLFVHRVEPDGSDWLETVNQAAERSLGMKAAAARGRRIEEVLPPGAAARVRACLDRAIATGEVIRTEEVYRERGDVAVEIIYVPLRERTEGPVTRVFASVRNITHLRAAEAALRESEARHRLLADHSTDMIVQLDLDTTRRYVSPAARELLGYEPHELVGTRPMDFVHPDGGGALGEVLPAMAEGRLEQAVTEQRYRHRDGSYVWVEIRARLYHDEAGRPAGYVASVRDISKRKAAEAEAERARLAAESARAAQERFLTTMSHEIRTPLNAVIGFTDLLLAADLAPTQARQARLIQASGQALLALVDDVLDMARVEAGAVVLTPRPFSLPDLLEECLEIARAAARAKPLALTLTLDPTLPAWLVGDAGRLRQVLLNLLVNAVKFTAAGTVALSARRDEEGSGEGERLVIAVSDTGIGIAPEQQGRLFQRFVQGDEGIARAYGGSGLGLAIARHLVELMGGRIGLVSRPGEGATFWVRLALPRAGQDRDVDQADERAAERGRHEPGPEPASPPPPASDRPARLLLAEDVEVNQELARALLEAAGYRVDVVGDGAEAVAAVQRTAYDLVLMDVQMPGLDGLQATRAIRALPGPRARVPVIALTANVGPDRIDALQGAGLSGHVAKPIHRQTLLGVIEQALERARRG